MATIEKALQIAAKAHEGQTDKDSQPYILHPLRVMHRVEGLEAQIVAILRLFNLGLTGLIQEICIKLSRCLRVLFINIELHCRLILLDRLGLGGVE